MCNMAGFNLRDEIRSAVHEATEESKQKLLSISSIQAETWQDILRTAGLTHETVPTLPGSGREKQVDGFGWDDKLERAQAYR